MLRALIAIVFMSSISSAVFAEVVEVYRWKVYPEKDVETLALFERSAAIHNGMGISVQINRLNIGTTQHFTTSCEMRRCFWVKDEASTSADF